jgi:hypothetical protein
MVLEITEPVKIIFNHFLSTTTNLRTPEMMTEDIHVIFVGWWHVRSPVRVDGL